MPRPSNSWAEIGVLIFLALVFLLGAAGNGRPLLAFGFARAVLLLAWCQQRTLESAGYAPPTRWQRLCNVAVFLCLLFFLAFWWHHLS
jgi:hypothetical protein